LTKREPLASETGETLIEVLIAVVIFSLSVVALLGALVTSITSSSEHRSLASDDTVLRSFAEAAKYEIQMQPGALFRNCATTYTTKPATAYRVVNVYPSSGPVGTFLTVFGTDFNSRNDLSAIFGSTLTALLAPGSVVTSLPVNSVPEPIMSGASITIGSGSTAQIVTASGPATQGATSIPVNSFTSNYAQPAGSTVYDAATAITSMTSGSTVDPNGNVAATFVVPVIPAGSYPVILSDGSSSAPSATNFVVTPSLGALSPGSGPSGTSVTVPASGFEANTALTVTVNGTSATVTGGSPTGANGSATGTGSTVTFTIPTGLTTGTTYPVKVSDGINSAGSSFTAATSAGGPGAATAVLTSAVSGTSVGISSLQWWNSSNLGWDPSTGSCLTQDQSGIQQITLTATAANGVSDQLSFIVTYPGYSSPAPAPAATISASSPTFGLSESFTLTLTGYTTCPTNQPSCVLYPKCPTSQPCIQWTLTGPGTSTPTCTNTLLAHQTGTTNISQSTCVVSSVLGGNYEVTANYSGDANYSPMAGYGSVTVPTATPTNVVTNSTPTTLGSNVTFTATVTGSAGITPTGTVTWTVSGSAGITSCTSSTTTLSGSGTATCSITVSNNGSYVVSDSYSGDSNYSAVTSSADSITVGPTMTITFPVNGSYYDANSGSWTGTITGTASSNSGPSLSSTAVAIENTTTGKWWNGTSFSATSQSFMPANGTTSWTLAFAATNLVTGDSYSVIGQVTNSAGNVGTSSTTSFTFDTTAPTVTGVYPPVLGHGASAIDVTVTGSNFVSGATVSFGDSGITFGTVMVVNSTTMTVPVTVTSFTYNAKTVTVTNPGPVSGNCTTCFTLKGNSNLTSLSITGPTAVGQGTSTTLTLSVGGSNCSAWGTPAVYFSNPGISVTAGDTVSCSGSSPYTVLVPITVSASALTGPGSVTVVVTSGNYAISTNGLTVDG
jgi:type II secretory pathway pseudopilin PulG